ncbi:hypothetical protein HLASF_3110 (plasmid) [Halanaeroarchaeum sulfurireducens]|uniref:Zinc-ribbon domain-containing protein n=1 Tax=Halanaeroarchaeum sulfurireducens TaxID=1604004 RepID=A0A0F7PC72_9EURY|nr:hypothetical protein HLASF_3110 [Halanaeroarchaeum sulfurireducens]ALG83180.1 hypothetical protein HLASA_3112 [Halanaeroarchaeum sulfurireducens]
MGLLSTLRRGVDGETSTLWECRNCGQTLSEDADECPTCGAESIASYEF